ncbi:MAG: ABC transporter ATP-binding protein [Thermotogota bacterium]|nr:ABC transporter ATP-binding protein [Thermotogota bacterium]
MESIKKVFAYSKEFHKKIYWAVTLAVLSVFSGIVPYYLVYRIFNGILVQNETSIITFLSLSLLVFVFLIAKSFLFLRAMAASHEAAFDTLMGIRYKLAEKMMKMPLGEIKKTGSGKLKNMFVDVVEDMELILAHMIPEGISYIVAPIVTILIIAFVDWRMALLALGTLPIGMVSMWLMMRNSPEKSAIWYASSNNMNRRIVEYIGGMEVIKIFNQTTRSFKKYSDSVDDFKKYTLDWYKECWNFMAIFFAVVPHTLFLSVPIGAIFFLNGTLTLSHYLLCLLLTMALAEPMVKLVRFPKNLNMLKKKVSSLDGLLKGTELTITSKNLVPNNNHVTFENVTFAYDKKKVLKQCRIPPKKQPFPKKGKSLKKAKNHRI